MKTWRDLKLVLDAMTEEELDQTITVRHVVMDEYWGVESFENAVENDVLDKGHLFLNFGS